MIKENQKHTKKLDDGDCSTAPCSAIEESEMSAEEALKHGINVVGWYALRSLDDTHWLGDDDGVVCYKHLITARVSHAIISKQLGSGRSNYQIKTYFSENQVKGDNIIVLRTAEKAIAELETSQS